MATATEIQNLSIEEASGVDAPANEAPGWIVMKSEDGPAKAAAELTALYGTLNGMTGVDTSELPDEVQKHFDGVNDFLESVLTTDEPEERPSVVEKLRSLFSVEKGGKKKAPADEEDAAEDAADGGDDEAEEDASGKKKKKGVYKSEDEPVEKAEDIVKAQLEPVTKALDELAVELDDQADENEVLKEALAKALDRIELLEDLGTGSMGLDGQEAVVEKSGNGLQGAILSAAGGHRVQMG